MDCNSEFKLMNFGCVNQSNETLTIALTLCFLLLVNITSCPSACMHVHFFFYMFEINIKYQYFYIYLKNILSEHVQLRFFWPQVFWFLINNFGLVTNSQVQFLASERAHQSFYLMHINYFHPKCSSGSSDPLIYSWTKTKSFK